jgi:hypothetical protein
MEEGVSEKHEQEAGHREVKGHSGHLRKEHPMATISPNEVSNLRR